MVENKLASSSTQTVTTDWHTKYDRTVSNLVREMLNVTDALLIERSRIESSSKWESSP